MNNTITKKLCAALFSTAILSIGLFSQTQAAPLPAGTTLTVMQGSGSGTNIPCSGGSCYGIEVSPGLAIWSDIGPGTDSGIIVGTEQGPPGNGGNIFFIAPTSVSCEMAGMWSDTELNYTCFSTAPGGTSNSYNDASCAGTGCAGQTDINALYLVTSSFVTGNLGNGTVYDYTVNPDTTYSLGYSTMIPIGDPSGFGGQPVRLILRGQIVLPPTCTEPPVANITTLPPSGVIELGEIAYLLGGGSYDPCGGPLTYSWDEDAVEFSTDATTEKTYTGLPDVYTVGLTVTDSQGLQDSVSTDIKVGPPHINGFWPSAAPPGSFVFIFGENFKTASGAYPTVCFDTNCTFLNQLLSDDLMLTIVPAEVSVPTSVLLHVNTDVTTGTSFTNWGTTSDCSIDGFWPTKARAGTIVFIFGSGFDIFSNVFIGDNISFLTQVQDSTLVLFIVPPGATSGPICVTCADGRTICSRDDLIILP